MDIAELKEVEEIIDFQQFNPGYTLYKQGIVFRLFAPRATRITLTIFDHYERSTGADFNMHKDSEGLWNFYYPRQDIVGKWYAYSIFSLDESDFFESTDHFIADPWSKFVTKRNHYLGFAKTKILKQADYDWDGTDFVTPKDPRDLVIYETHIKDMVAHPSAKTYVQGVYNDFREAQIGGINHLKQLGVNAVEFLPLQNFAYYEPPFNEEIANGLTNTWNPHSRNHWGYMTSFHFAPETMYSSDSSYDEEAIVGRHENAVKEVKDLVKALHKEDISVIMDVVYNHASQYDLNPLKYTAKDHYFRLDNVGHYLNDSWTGNDINTSAKYSRKLIVESVKYWMKEYKIDGFRFDLAGIIDWETVDMIREEARKINPDAILIAEPWGGEYKPAGFSDRDWISWNDRIRNGFKGYDPYSNKGLLLGEWSHGTSRFALENFIRGTLKNAEHGLFNTSKHSVNYIESHDGYTLGDFIRLALNPDLRNKSFKNKNEVTKLNEQQMAISKLAALSLFVSQGVTMIHAGQEWARAKLIVDHDNKDKNVGKLDHDSYNKDNETNWLNFSEISLNRDLFNYYQQLIKIRLQSPALRKAQPEEINFKVYKDPLHITFSIDGRSTGDQYDYFISLNGNKELAHEIVLPQGSWQVLADAKSCDFKGIKSIKNTFNVAPSSGVLLRKLRVSNA